MRWLRGTIDRLILLICVLAGGCIPGFVGQYTQHLAGRLAQARLDLGAFVQIAERHHGGDLAALISHHLHSSDPTFKAEGAVIETLVHNVAALQAEMDALAGGIWSDLGHLSTHADATLINATWQNFEPTFSFTTDGILVAGLFGLVVWMLFQGSWAGLTRVSYQVLRKQPTERV